MQQGRQKTKTVLIHNQTAGGIDNCHTFTPHTAVIQLFFFLLFVIWCHNNSNWNCGKINQSSL